VGTLIALTTGLVFWICATALGMKSFDAFMVTLALLLAGVTGRLVMPYVRERILP
jgi:hypothetical protein